jgi:hypothetical protein
LILFWQVTSVIFQRRKDSELAAKMPHLLVMRAMVFPFSLFLISGSLFGTPEIEPRTAKIDNVEPDRRAF